ncbi:MAG: protein-L-isoaspartate(D-aspartate) O-methyltransferase [Candidatus Odinarchaeia archaeon]
MSSKYLAQIKKKTLERLKQSGVIKTPEVEQAFLKVPREEFLPGSLRERAYDDTPLPIGYGQTISAIHMVMIMVEELKLKKGLKMLEIGTGSGYHAAIAAEIISSPNSKNGVVHSIERIKELAIFALKNLIRTGYKNRVRVYLRDGTKGLKEKAPFDRILVTAASPSIPPPLIEQLNDPGILLIPVGSRGLWQNLIKIEKKKGKILRTNLGGVAFVPLIGEYGFKN